MSTWKYAKRSPAAMSFRDALDLTDSMGLPDGAAWALAEEMAGFESGCADPAELIDDERKKSNL